MAGIRWTHQALDDVEKIREYIARDSVNYAKLFIRKIFNAVDRLELFPECGRNVPEFGQANIREIILGHYRIIYQTNKNNIEILTIYHASRLLDEIDGIG